MPFCKKCGCKLDEDSGYCRECGAPVEDSKKKSLSSETDQSQSNNKTIRIDTPKYGIINLENLPIGHIIDDRYEIKEKLGQGGFGAVYSAYDKKMEVDKALKIFPEALSNDIEAMENLRKEAKTMIKLNHSSIVRVYDFYDKGSIKYIDMEYIDGKTLTQLKLEHPDKRIPEEKVKSLTTPILEGLTYAHSKNIIHKDISPQNIIVTNDGKVKIMDFGIAETVHTSMSVIKNVSITGKLMYMSPEQVRGRNINQQSDIYSLGATLYDLLSGHPPFYKGDIGYQIINENPEDVEGITSQLNSVIQKCLEKDPKERYQNCEDLREALNEVVSTLHRPVGTVPPTKPITFSSRKKIIGIAGLLIIGTFSIIYIPDTGKLIKKVEESVDRKETLLEKPVDKKTGLIIPISPTQTFIQHTWNKARNIGDVPTELYDPKDRSKPLVTIPPGQERTFTLTNQREIIIKFGSQEERIKVIPNRPPEVNIELVTTKMNRSDIYVKELQRITAFTVKIIDNRPEQLKVTYSGPISVSGPQKDSKGNLVYNVSLKLAANETQYNDWLERNSDLQESDGRYKVNFFFTVVDERTKDRVQVGDSFYFTEFSNGSNREKRIKVIPNRSPEVNIELVTTKMNRSDIYVKELQRITAFIVKIIDNRPEQLKVTYSGPIGVSGPQKDSKGNIVYNVSLKLAANEAQYDAWIERNSDLQESDGRYKANFFFTVVDERTKDRVQVGDSFYFTEFSNGSNKKKGVEATGDSSFGFDINWEGQETRKIFSFTLPKFPEGIEKEVDVKLEFTILPDGFVGTIIPKIKANTRLENAAINSLRQWRFEALSPNQKQVEQTAIIVFPYRLK